MKLIKILVLNSLILILSSCSKDDKPSISRSLSGRIIHEYSSDVMQIDLKTGNESSFFSYNAYSLEGWDLSKDGKFRLMSERPPGTYSVTRFKLVDVATGTIVKEFDYNTKFGNNTKIGYLSYDNTMILLQPDFENGIVILDMNGTEKYRLDGINGTALTYGDYVHWLPGNGILIEFDDRFLLRSEAPYTDIALVKEMNYESWGGVQSSRDGQRYTLYIGRHIYLMNKDGSNLTQVTESDAKELYSTFSPDDKYLLIGTDFFDGAGAANSHWFLKAIPADGKKYDVDTSPEVISIISNGSQSPVKANKSYWIP